MELKDGDLFKTFQHSETWERSNFGTKFSLRGRGCNIPGLEATKWENTKVCIAFMHRKSGEFSRFQIKLTTVTEVSLDLLELK